MKTTTDNGNSWSPHSQQSIQWLQHQSCNVPFTLEVSNCLMTPFFCCPTISNPTDLTPAIMSFLLYMPRQSCLGVTVYVPRLRTQLSAGEFVSITGTSRIGLILDICRSFEDIPETERPTRLNVCVLEAANAHPGNQWVYIQWFYQVDDDDGASIDVPPLDNFEFYFVKNKEVYASQHLEWVPAHCLSGIVFVFHYKSIQDGTFPCTGISNAYALRYGRTNDLALMELDQDNFIPFLSIGGFQTFSMRVWKFIQAVSRMVATSLKRP